ATRNKIMTASRLRSAGVPIPRSWVTGDVKLLLSLAAERQLIMKPSDGRRGTGIRCVNERRGPAFVPPLRATVLGQECGRGRVGPVVVDLKYVPSYRGVPEAAPLIADYIEDYAKEHGPRLVVDQLAREVAV